MGGTCDTAPLPPSLGGEGRWLRDQAVTPAVKDGYRRAVAVFLYFCVALSLPLHGRESIDLALCKFSDERYLEGGGPAIGERLLSAWLDSYPEFAAGDFPNFLRSLRGWRRLRPKRGRHPLPYAVLCALAVYVSANCPGGRLAGYALVVLYDTYLRPYELFFLRLRDVLLPVDALQHISLLVCPFERKRPTKSGVYDDTVVMNSILRPEAERCLAMAVDIRKSEGASEDDLLFTFSHEDLARWFSEGLEFLNLSGWGFVLYCCRHGAPSEDIARCARSLPEVGRRGRWIADSSVRRYEQRGRLHLVLSRLDPAVLNFCQQCQQHMLQLLASPRCLLRPIPSSSAKPPNPDEYEEED